MVRSGGGKDGEAGSGWGRTVCSASDWRRSGESELSSTVARRAANPPVMFTRKERELPSELIQVGDAI